MPAKKRGGDNGGSVSAVVSSDEILIIHLWVKKRNRKMASLVSSHHSLVILNRRRSYYKPPLVRSPTLSFSAQNPRFSSFRINSSLSNDSESSSSDSDSWESEPEAESKLISEADPPIDEDEWGRRQEENDYVSTKLGELKQSLVDTFYGTELGLGASPEVRAEVLELVNQLEALNPTPAPTSAASLDGNWVLLYTAFSELLPLLAAGTTPLLKLTRICQTIDTRNLVIENSVTFSSPFATFSFSASADFEVRSSSRIQVTFKEGTLNPPEISSSLSLPENLDIFGQKLDLSLLQRSLNPLQDAVVNISRAVSGQPPLKVPIPGDRSSSWLLTTYLDEDFRISRGDGGLFVLAKEGSPLLQQ